MRLLHTSDWHLGRGLLAEPLVAYQGEFLDWLVSQAETRRVDAVVIAGDVFDRAVPPVEAVALFQDALLRLSRLCPVILVPGNHDSPTRLGFAGPLLEAARVHIRSTIDDIDRPVLLSDAGGVEIAVYGIPFLHPDLHHRELGVERTHPAVVGEALSRVRADLSTRSCSASVVVAHAFVTGAVTSDSERDVSVGGIGDVPATVFEGITYAALGHLHRPQVVTAPEGVQVRYSGSPLAYSFSESGQTKGVVQVDIDEHGDVQATMLEFDVPRQLAVIRGELEQLLTDDQWTDHEDSWVRAVITDQRRPADAMERLRTRFPHAIDLAFEPAAVATDSSDPRRWDPRVAEPIDVTCAFIEYATGTPATDGERVVLGAAIDAVRTREVAT